MRPEKHLLKELSQWLKTGGLAIFQTPMPKILFNIQAELYTLHKREKLHEKHPKTESLLNRDGVGSETALEGG